MYYSQNVGYQQPIGSYQQAPYSNRPPYHPIQYGSQVLPPQHNMVYHHPIPVSTQTTYLRPSTLVQPPPPVDPAQQVYQPNMRITSWHPLEAKIPEEYINRQKQLAEAAQQRAQLQNQNPYQNYNQQFQSSDEEISSQSRGRDQKSRKKKSSLTKEQLDEINTPNFASTKTKKLSMTRLKNHDAVYEDENEDKQDTKSNGEYNEDDEELEDEDDDEDLYSESYNSDLDDTGYRERDEIRNKFTLFKLGELGGGSGGSSHRSHQGGQMILDGLGGLRKNRVTDENRFEILSQHQKINKQHANLFGKDYVEDLQMRDIFGDRHIHIEHFDLQGKSQKTVPTFLWHKSQQNMTAEIQNSNLNVSIDEPGFGDLKHRLWEARYAKIHEYDYMVSQNNNLFSRKSNYLKLGLFYKQAQIKFSYDRMKEIVYYMYSYDEYSIKKKKSEIQQEENQQEKDDEEINIKINSLQNVEEEDDNQSPNKLNNSSKSNKDVLHTSTLSKQSKSGEPESSKYNLNQKSMIYNPNKQSRVLNSSQLTGFKSKVMSTTTQNKQDVKSQIKDTYDFAKSHFLRDYEKIHGQESIQEDDNELYEQSRNLTKSQVSQERSSNSQHSDNYSKLYKRGPAGQRKKVIERKEDDLSRIKGKHNKYKLWEKNAVSEDLFLDQVRDSTIEAVKRARNLEQAIVEKTSIFEHHAASLLNQHLSQLRKVSREYKQLLYLKVKEIIQLIYDEYREVITFESNNTFVMLVCDKRDNDRILGLHYHGYQGKKYFEKYFDEFVTYNKTKSDFETKRFQAFLLNKFDESYCKQYFMV